MLTNREKYFIACVRYYTGKRKSGVGGFHYNLNLPVAKELDAQAHELATEIVGASNVKHGPWLPANDFQERRWLKAYTDRGLKVA